MSAQRNCFLSLSPGSTLNPGFSLVQPGVQENRRRIVTQAKATADPSAAQPEVQTSVCPSEIGRHSPQSLLVQESAIESPAQVEPAQFRRMGCSLKAPPHFRPRSGQTRRAVGANPRWNVEALCDPFGVEWVFGFEPWANAHGYSGSVPAGQPGVHSRCTTANANARSMRAVAMSKSGMIAATIRPDRRAVNEACAHRRRVFELRQLATEVYSSPQGIDGRVRRVTGGYDACLFAADGEWIAASCLASRWGGGRESVRGLFVCQGTG